MADAPPITPSRPLTERQETEFYRLAKILEDEGRLDRYAVDTIEMAVIAITQIAEATAAIEKYGYVYETASDRGGHPIIRANPAVEQRDKAMVRLTVLLKELGLTPASAARIADSLASDAENEFSEWL